MRVRQADVAVCTDFKLDGSLPDETMGWGREKDFPKRQTQSIDNHLFCAVPAAGKTSPYRTRLSAELTSSMDASISYGFLEVLSDETLGFTGGLLLVDQNGKPTEFHCTAPVVENKTQKILFGQTYRGHIFCDLIGAALIKKCSTTPELLFVNQKELAQLAGEIASPVLMVSKYEGEPDPIIQTIQYPEFRIDDLNVSALTTDLGMFEFLKEACDRFTSTLTLDEPFERIRQAIGEAQNVARQSDAA